MITWTYKYSALLAPKRQLIILVNCQENTTKFGVVLHCWHLVRTPSKSIWKEQLLLRWLRFCLLSSSIKRKLFQIKKKKLLGLKISQNTIFVGWQKNKNVENWKNHFFLNLIHFALQASQELSWHPCPVLSFAARHDQPILKGEARHLHINLSVTLPVCIRDLGPDQKSTSRVYHIWSKIPPTAHTHIKLNTIFTLLLAHNDSDDSKTHNICENIIMTCWRMYQQWRDLIGSLEVEKMKGKCTSRDSSGVHRY